MHLHTTLILIIIIVQNKYPFVYLSIQIAPSLMMTGHAPPQRILCRSIIFPCKHIIFIVVPDCHCDDSWFHRCFQPYCSVPICCKNPFPQAPFAHREIPRHPSISKELTVGNLFPSKQNESI